MSQARVRLGKCRPAVDRHGASVWSGSLGSARPLSLLADRATEARSVSRVEAAPATPRRLCRRRQRQPRAATAISDARILGLSTAEARRSRVRGNAGGGEDFGERERTVCVGRGRRIAVATEYPVTVFKRIPYNLS